MQSEGVPKFKTLQHRWMWIGVAAVLALLTIPAILLREKATQPTLVFKKVARNADWEPVIREFDGVPMALVPPGCFMMGSETGEEDERPSHEQCFEEPFWIDVTEVTVAQVGEYEFSPDHIWGGEFPIGPNFPRDSVDWFAATAYCHSRGTRLPTEMEWEYAARGPDGLVYPWGNEFVPENVAYGPNTDYYRTEVGSFPGDVSWVGALDMSGNVWEWTSSVYAPYPYDPGDGREVDASMDDKSPRVRRGGSWYWYNEDDLRLANRYRPTPYRKHWDGGFRCARSYD